MDPPKRKPLTSELLEFEEEWVRRYEFLKAFGYQLRPRYIPRRTPDWKASGVHPPHCEDFIAPPAMHPNLMDAIRIEDGKRVYIKRLTHGENELSIASKLSPLSAPHDSRNHSVPIIETLRVVKRPRSTPKGDDALPDMYYVVRQADIDSGAVRKLLLNLWSHFGMTKGSFAPIVQPDNKDASGAASGECCDTPSSHKQTGPPGHEQVTSSADEKDFPQTKDSPKAKDPPETSITLTPLRWHSACEDDDEDTAYLIMPFLLPIDEVPFETVDNVVDFVEQVMQGLVYMHLQGVAHRDCSIRNIMMDADALFPKGLHPLRTHKLADGRTPAPRLSRSAVSVKYYFIDYGISTAFEPPDTLDRNVTGVDGIDQDVPELSDDEPYDAIKVDIFLIGNLLKKEVHGNYKNVRFLKPLFQVMTSANPSERPEAAEAYEQWKAIRDRISSFKRSQRLRSRDEGLVLGLFVDIYTVVSLVVQLPKRAAVAALRRTSRKKPAAPTA